ncbi:MAG: hypothetical protein ACYTJ0_06880 [Planctomycetota bacterium]|jgi:hypothetical protein
MLSHERKRRLIGFAVFALPIALLKCTGLIFGGAAPADAAASTGAGANPIPGAGDDGIRETRWTPRQLELAEYVAKLRDQPFGDTPLRSPSRERRPVVEPTPPAQTEHPLEVTVTGMIHGTGGAVAWIDGKAVRVGDAVQDHRWEIVEIDVARRSVRFRHTANGQEAVRFLPSPR